MIELIEWLHIFISAHPSFEYIIIFFGVAFGGDLVLFIFAFLVAQKVIPISPFILLSFLGSLFSNTLWFLFGKTTIATKIISHRYANTTISITTEAITRISKGNRFFALAIIKFFIGTFLTLIIYTNKTGLKWKQFIYYETIIIFIWLLFYVPIGYFSGIGFIYLSEAFNSLSVAIGFILFVLFAITVFQMWLEKHLSKN